MLSLAVGLLMSISQGQQPGALAVENVRPTYGYLGAPHLPKDGRLPGDVIYFTFDIKNLKTDATGRASYSMLVEVFDHDDKLSYKVGPTNSVAQNFLGGNSLPCSAAVSLPPDAQAGPCKFRLTVEDRNTKEKVVLNHASKILPLNFGIVQVGTFADREGRTPAPAIGVVGQSLYINYGAVGFARGKDSKQPDVEVALKILEKGQPTMPNPLTGRIFEDVPADVPVLHAQFGITLNRPGFFQIELTATDKVSGKTSHVTFPLRVVGLVLDLKK